MKGKVLVVLVALLLASSVFALESGPSNPVGFFTLTISRQVGSNGYNLVSFPTIPTDASLTNTLGAQLPGGAFASNATQIQWYDAGAIPPTYRTAFKTNTGTIWNTGGGITQLETRKGYYILLRSSSPLTSYSVVVAGNVNVGPATDMGTIYVGYNMVGSAYAAPVLFANSNIVSGTTRFVGGAFSTASDQIIGLLGTSFQTAWRNNSGVWQGPINSFEPGRGYLVLRRSGRTPANYTWPDYPVPPSVSSTASFGNETISFPNPGATIDVVPLKAEPVRSIVK